MESFFYHPLLKQSKEVSYSGEVKGQAGERAVESQPDHRYSGKTRFHIHGHVESSPARTAHGPELSHRPLLLKKNILFYPVLGTCKLNCEKINRRESIHILFPINIFIGHVKSYIEK